MKNNSTNSASEVKHHPAGSESPLPHALTVAERVSQAFLLAWNPIPLDPPEIDSDLSQLSSIERVTEIVRFNILELESGISPNGGLRAWLKLNILISLFLGIPALIVVPVITYLLSGFSDWTAFLFLAAKNLLYTSIAVLLLVMVAIATGRIVAIQMRSINRRSRRRK